MTATHCWQVVLPGPLMTPFTYRAAAGMDVAPGVRVRVPFGRTERVGVVWAPAGADPVVRIGQSAEQGSDRVEIKPISHVLDREPLLSTELMACLDWAARYYHYPLGEVALAAFPPAVREGGSVMVPALRLTEAGREALASQPPRGSRQKALLETLCQSEDGLPIEALTSVFSSAVRRSLAEKGWIEVTELPVGRGWRSDIVETEAAAMTVEQSLSPKLNPAQQQAVDAVAAQLDGFGVWLLEGVTGSGKTEVYLDLIRRVLDAGRQALVLVPEIALTPQLIGRFRQRLGVEPAVLHSGLSAGARLQAWSAVQDGQANLVIGTRSAVFQPFGRLGLIVVDEEHDPALKQQEGFGYHARDVAIWRARQTGIPIVLGSATPALESIHNRDLGRYHGLYLPERAGGAGMPRLQLLDIRNQRMRGGLSDILVDAIEQHLTAGGQVMLYLNRRGYAPSLLCHQCGWVAACSHCDAFMTWHRRAHVLRCHHCGHERPVPPRCPSCSTELATRGLGTEQLEDVLTSLFPEFGIERLDRDATSRRGELGRRLARIRSGEARLVIGTQMLVKGHDFPAVSLVGVIDADQGLFSNDFRGPERFAQQLIQVAGRAGRADRSGTVLIQTHHPEHLALRRLLAGGYADFAQEQLEERAEAGLPPSRPAALIRSDSRDADAAQQVLDRISQLLAHPDLSELERWGPVPSPLARRAGRYRFQLLVLAADRGLLHRALAWLDAQIGTRRLRGVRWTIDVDPVDMG